MARGGRSDAHVTRGILKAANHRLIAEDEES
jgi:hypothetical protein